MNVIIAGAGSVGRYMAGQLQDSGHNVTLIDNNSSVVAQGRATRQEAVATSKANSFQTTSAASPCSATPG